MDFDINNNEETVDLYSFSNPKKRNKKRKIRRIVNIVASIVLSFSVLLTAVMGAGIWALGQKINDDSEVEEGEFEGLTYSTDSKVSYILVVGVDPQETLTDIIIVACIDHEKNTLNFLQIPRDTYIGDDVPTKKVNAVHGNPRKGERQINALRRRLSSYFGIPLDHYVKFTVRGFSNVIDALGGVTVDIETPNSNGIDIMNPFTKKHERVGPGVVTLTGPQAVGFVRKRTGVKDGYVKGDIDRIEAQREVYVSLAKKLQSMSTGQMVTIAKNCYNEVATDMSISQILGYANEVQDISMESMGIYAVPGQFATYNGLSMWSPHKDEYIEIFNTYFNPYGTPITTEDIQMIELHKRLGNATRPSEVEQGGSLSNVKK
ncbi:MAG: LCP family protein [Clostridia bacterium]|nr:LCP family protein [Clostridia bacterium]MBQ9919703.1 LCP family protein [Clostridia bacterium]